MGASSYKCIRNVDWKVAAGDSHLHTLVQNDFEHQQTFSHCNYSLFAEFVHALLVVLRSSYFSYNAVVSSMDLPIIFGLLLLAWRQLLHLEICFYQDEVTMPIYGTVSWSKNLTKRTCITWWLLVRAGRTLKTWTRFSWFHRNQFCFIAISNILKELMCGCDRLHFWSLQQEDSDSSRHRCSWVRGMSCLSTM